MVWFIPAPPDDAVIGIIEAVAQNDITKVQTALDGGADIHCEDDLPLRSAIGLGHADMVEFLISKGADVHVLDERCLLMATHLRDQKTFLLLLAHQADVDKLIEKNADVLELTDRHFIDDALHESRKHLRDQHIEQINQRARAMKPIQFKRK